MLVHDLRLKTIGIIGLGYVGLPLALAFGKQYKTIGFDINSEKIQHLNNGIDKTNEHTPSEIKESKLLKFCTTTDDLKECSVYIITVQTPITKDFKPDLKPLFSATELVAQFLKKNDIVVYESTVYPGCTEEECVPVLEKISGLNYNKDFFCGYSPERINPGDKERKLSTIVKITSGSTPEIAEIVNTLYGSIITAGTFKADSIKIAEAAKLIENCQRDVNISFVNELSLIFDRLGIETDKVLEAASTKWNFLRFSPGLVGGHCISVDPYYMIYKAESVGFSPKVIGSGREVNNFMPIFIASKIFKKITQNTTTKELKDIKVLLKGFAYKPNTSDFRNTKVIDIYNELTKQGVKVDIYDPLVEASEVEKEYGIQLVQTLDTSYDEIYVAVKHTIFS